MAKLIIRYNLHIKIYNLRRLYNYSQQDLADKAGVSQQDIGKAERNTTKVYNEDFLKKLAAALGISLKKLLEDT